MDGHKTNTCKNSVLHFKKVSSIIRKTGELLIEQDFAEAYTMVTSDSCMSNYCTDKPLNIHVSVVERDLTSEEAELLPSDAVSGLVKI